MPLCIKNTLQKIFILDITATVFGLLTWNLEPRWSITLIWIPAIIVHQYDVKIYNTASEETKQNVLSARCLSARWDDTPE